MPRPVSAVREMLRAVTAVTLVTAVTAALLPLPAARLQASVGGFAVMNCHLDFPFGNEIPYHLQWEKDGEVILSWYSSGEMGESFVSDRYGGRVRRVSDGRAGLGRGSLNVSAVRETDAGLYRCRVTFPNRTPPERNNGTFYYLDVDGTNLIVTPPTNITVLEGERAELECVPKEAEWTPQWYRDGIALSSLPELAARVDLQERGALVLPAAQAADAGEYSCRVSAPGGVTQSASAYLDVHYKAKVVYAPAERYLPHGKPASLDCHFSANPPLTNLRWEKDGFLFDPYNVPGVFYSRNGSLLFNKVDISHEGIYSCTAYNALGSAGASRGVHVRVAPPPALLLRPRPLYVARKGQVVAMPCRAEYTPPHPEPALIWTRKDGRPMPIGRHSLDGGNLTLADVTEEDRGVYECRVAGAGEAVEARAETELLVEHAPRPPHALRLERVRENEATLSWEPGMAEAEYTVWFRRSGAEEWRTLKVPAGVTQVALKQLEGDSTYELRVLAQDQLGDGLFSKSVFVTTRESDNNSINEDDTSSREESALAAASGLEGAGRGEGQVAGLEVTVRRVPEGALVVWSRAGGQGSGGRGGGECELRWYEGAPPHDVPLFTARTRHDHMLVSEATDSEYYTTVRCGGPGGAVWGAGRLAARAGRLGVALLAAAAAALILLAVAAAALYARRIRAQWSDVRRRWCGAATCLLLLRALLGLRGHDAVGDAWGNDAESSTPRPHQPASAPRDAAWQPVAGTRYRFFVYSAYLDLRSAPVVRVIAATRTRLADRVLCRLTARGHRTYLLPADVVSIREHGNLPYSAAFVLCSLQGVNVTAREVSGGSVSVLAAAAPGRPAGNILPVIDTEPYSENEDALHVCVKPFHYSYARTSWLIEWLELQRMLGVKHFLMYNHSLAEPTACLLQHYEKQGLVTLLQWELPIVSQKEIRTEGLFAAFNDCLYRSMTSAGWLLVIDVDEVVFPKEESTMSELLASLTAEVRPPQLAPSGYLFRNAFFYMQWEDDATANTPLVTSRKTRRVLTPHRARVRSKYVLRPRGGEELGNHFVWAHSGAGYSVVVDPERALLHHYREVCEFGGTDCLNIGSSVDRTAHRWTDEVLQRIAAEKHTMTCSI